MSFYSNCNGKPFATQTPDPSLILKKLRWESGPASIPDPGEIISIIENARRELVNCEAQTKASESRRESLQMYISQLQALLLPVRKMPDEILRRIFDDCCDMNTVVQPSYSLTETENRPAIALSGVCSRWRRNALSLPAIWSRISVVCEQTRQEEHKEHNLNLIDTFLDRALQYPLTVSIELTGDYYGRYQAVLTRLFNSTDRWYSFTFKAACLEFRDLISACNPSLVQPDFPLLEYLHIDDDSTVYDLLNLFIKAQKLKNLIVPFINEEDSLSFFEQLTHLEFYSTNHFDIQAVVYSGLVSLKTEELVYVLDDEDNEEAVPTLHTSNIDTLTICHDPGVQQTRRSIFLYLTLPVLKTIHLEGRFDGRVRRSNWANFDPFVAFLLRSSCPLTTLSIEKLALADSKLVDILTQLPTLQHLSIDDSDVIHEKSPITGWFIESLQVNLPGSVRGQTNLILPRLHSLKLSIGASIFEDASIVDMVGSRWIPDRCCSTNGMSDVQVDCLREFTVRFRNREEIKGVYQLLEDLEKNGLRAVVLWKT